MKFAKKASQPKRTLKHRKGLKDSKRNQKITASPHSYQSEQTSVNSDSEQARRPREPAATVNRRGQSQRKSYTVEFQLKTLELLDSLRDLKFKNCWNKETQERGVSKSLVVKWNMSRKKNIG